ncbi:MAG: two-component regulator propeller domain-containing protein [Bacteroidota bacterium]
MTTLRYLTYCLICLLGCLLASAQDPKPSFRQLTAEDGLSNNWVKTILKDQRGFMWFGTSNGLNRYDGQEFKVFRSDSINQLSDNFIQSLTEDKEGNIWVGTFSGGLNRFDRKTETFTVFKHDPNNPQSLDHNRITCTYLDPTGKLWVGTATGLNLYHPPTATFDHFHHDPQKPYSITQGQVSCIFMDQRSNLYVGTKNGLNIREKGQDSFRSFQHDSQDPTSLAHDHVTAIYEDKYGDIWIATWGGGLDKWSPSTQNFTHHKHHAQNPQSLSNNSVLDIQGDESHHIYIATEGGGLNIFDIEKGTFQALQPDLQNKQSLNSNSIHSLYYDSDNQFLWAGTYNGGINYFSKWDKPFRLIQAKVGGLNDNHITSVTEDKNGILWIGTDGGGINLYNPKNASFAYLNKAAGLQNNAILSLRCDRNNYLWVGTYNGGLDRISPDRKQIRHFRHDPVDPSSLSGIHISTIYEDKRGNIWIGTMEGGLNFFHPQTGTFSRYQHDPQNPQTINNNFIYGIFEDRLGRILVQTGNGLEIFDSQSQTFSRFHERFGTLFGVPVALCEDSQGNLWIGSKEQGLFRVDRTGVEVKRYMEIDGLPSNGISGIMEDKLGNLWISTQRGLCKFEEGVTKPERVRFRTYALEDGLQGNEFKAGAFCMLQSGQMVFAGQNGFNLFDPLKIQHNPFIPPVTLTGFKLFNKDVPFGTDQILSAPISETSVIALSYAQSVMTFEFSALNYMLSEKNQYAYKMEGFEDTWNYIGTQHNATYTNLDAGTYTFRVKAANNDGVWNEEGTKIQLTILPPWWEHPYSQLGAILFFIAIIFIYARLRTHQLKRSKRRLEHKVAIRTSDLEKANAISEARQKEISQKNEALTHQNHELERQSSEIRRMADEIRNLNEAKIRFFTNISHELRTPLNLILWPLEDLRRETNDQLSPHREKFELMHQNASKLVRLINQLLDFRKMETGTLQLALSQQDAMAAIRRTFDGFQSWADRKNISYQLETSLTEVIMCLDADKLDKILSNLLSNAFKFVESGGVIVVKVEQVSREGRSMLQVIVTDDGKGIEATQADRIFDRFYEGKGAHFPGSGIGLALAKELIDLQEGQIWVDSIPGEGATFTFQIPCDLPCEEISPSAPKENTYPTHFSSPPPKIQETNTPVKIKRATLLLVEDNRDISAIMAKKLRPHYDIWTAANGREGLRLAFEHVPDLIISDVMMPEMDGFALCQTLKEDERTSHIPVILLTARSGEESQMQGLSTGADDYITKPYQFELLHLKIQNRLFTQQKLKAQLSKDTAFIPQNLDISSIDEKFLRKAVEIVRENLQNSEFGVEDFSHYFHMSRRNVLRKMKGVTGLSINEFIRNTRLKVAHRMLLEGDLNVSEVAYQVGFTDPKYFSNCFKKQFGALPSKIKG